MQLRYNLDVDKESKWIIITPNQNAKELLFYVSEIGHFNAGKEFFTERTGKKEYYILFTLEGQGMLKHKGQVLHLDKHNAVMIYCDDYQYYATVSTENWEHVWVHFNGMGAQSYYNIINESGINSVYIEDMDSFVQNMEEIMQNPGVNDIKQSVLSSMHITNLLTMMVLGKYSVANIKVLTQHQQALDRVIEYIRVNYAQPITLEDFTEVVHLSKYYFLKLFKQFTGMTPYEYLINYRINKAKKLLRKTDTPISQISYAVGFPDECNFIRKFKATTGTTPLNFRKMSF